MGAPNKNQQKLNPDTFKTPGHSVKPKISCSLHENVFKKRCATVIYIQVCHIVSFKARSQINCVNIL